MPNPGPTGPVSGLSVTFTAFHAKNKAQTEAALSSSTMGLLLKGENRQRHVSKEKEGKWRRWRPVEEAKGDWGRKWEFLGVEKVEQGCVGEDKKHLASTSTSLHLHFFRKIPHSLSSSCAGKLVLNKSQQGVLRSVPSRLAPWGPAWPRGWHRRHSLLKEVLLGKFPPWAAPAVNLLLLFMFKDKGDLSSCINFPQRKHFRTGQISPDDVSERLIIATCRKG